MHGTWFTPLYKKGDAFMGPLTPEYLELLVDKKLRGIISPEEQVALNQWLHREPGEYMAWNSDDPDERKFRERLLKRIKESAGIPDYSPSVKRIPVLKHYKWAAVAVILLLITGGLGYFLFSGKGVTQVEIANNKVKIHNIAPGHSGAILTLANGNRIVLDSAGNGKITTQGNRQLIKKNGRLVYEKEAGRPPSKNGVLADVNIYNTITTPRGREFQVVLSDGSKVWLNAASSITFPTVFTGKERKVTITGEVYFEVARDSRHPFIVSADEARITVLGTHFDVMAYPEEKQIKTTLLEGSVRVSGGDQQVIITPGQQASFSAQSDHIHIAKVDAKQTVAWIEGKLSLDNLGVDVIMRKVSRWYNVDVEFEGPVPQGQYWGLINRDVSLSDMLRVMRASGIDAIFKDNKVIVLHN